MSYLGSRVAVGKKGIDTNPFGTTRWSVVFDPATLELPAEFDVYHISLNGPAPSTAQWFIDTTFYSNIARGDINDWDPSQVAFIRSGQTLYFYWDSGTAPAPVVTLFCRQPATST